MTGVHPRAGFTTGDYEEAGIKRADGRAAETVVMASGKSSTPRRPLPSAS
nr:Uncharacterised protein [Klebsiella pneumoniae]